MSGDDASDGHLGRFRRKLQERRASATSGGKNEGKDDDDSESDLDEATIDCGQKSKSIKTETSETTFEITIKKCRDVHCPKRVDGPVTYNIQGPVILPPNLSMDLLLQMLSREMQIPLERFENAMKKTGDNAELQQSKQQEIVLNVDPTASALNPPPAAIQGPPPPPPKGCQCGNGAGNRNEIKLSMLGINDQANNSSVPAFVEITNNEDEHGNLKVMVKIKHTISTKINTAMDETSVIMGKACALTVLCGIFILAAWLVIDKYEGSS